MTNAEYWEKMGATKAFNYKEEDWVKELADRGGVDMVLDMVGGEYVARNIDCLRNGGRHISIAFLEGVKA